MEILQTGDTTLGITTYPQTVSEIKSVINPQSFLWALIAVVLFVIYIIAIINNLCWYDAKSF